MARENSVNRDLSERIEDKIMFFGYYQFHESNYAILHMQKGAIASQEKHIKGIQL